MKYQRTIYIISSVAVLLLLLVAIIEFYVLPPVNASRAAEGYAPVFMAHTAVFEDGGSREYKSISYTIILYNRLVIGRGASPTIMGRQRGYGIEYSKWVPFRDNTEVLETAVE